jgi:hypothetical protein
MAQILLESLPYPLITRIARHRRTYFFIALVISTNRLKTSHADLQDSRSKITAGVSYTVSIR